MLSVAGTWMSIPLDFLLKSTSAVDLTPNLAALFPIATHHEPLLRSRVCALVCLTTHYADLWSTCFDPAWFTDDWIPPVPRLPPD